MLYMHLQLFAEGGGEAGGGEQAAANGIDFEQEFQRQFGGHSEVAAPKQAEETQKTADAPQETTDAKQPETAGNPQEEDPDAEFEKLIKGKLKGAYEKRFQSGLNERFRSKNAEITNLKQQVAAYKKAIAGYAQKVGADVNDPAALEQAVLNDKNNFREMALERGITVEEAVKEFQTEQAAQEAADAQRAAAEQAANAQEAQAQLEARMQKYAEWNADADEIRKTDPKFDLAAEIANNAEFKQALDAGFGVKFAYKATHFDERMAAVAGAVERQTAMATANRIAAGQKRPPEGGLNANPGAQTKVDYEKLSDKDFMDIFNRSMHY